MNKINEIIESMQDEIIESLQKLLRIKSIISFTEPLMPFGKSVNDALMFIINLSSKLGFEAYNLDGYAGYLDYGNGEDMVAAFTHLDVVPEGAGWECDPFEGIISEGKIFARGVVDNKGPLIATLYGLKALKEAQLNISKKIRLFFGTNEESGFNDVKYYLKTDKQIPSAGFTPDSHFPVVYAEKGVVTFDVVKKFCTGKKALIDIISIRGGNAPNSVPDYCECLIKTKSVVKEKHIIELLNNCVNKKNIWLGYKNSPQGLIIWSKGKTAHAAMPWYGKNAIIQLLSFLSDLDLNCETKEFISFFVKKIGMETDGAGMELDLKDETGSLTLNLSSIYGEEDSLILTFNIRYPATFRLRYIIDIFKSNLRPLGAEVTRINDKSPLLLSKDHPAVKTLQKVYREQTCSEPALKAVGSTYAKYIPNLVPFGPVFPGNSDLGHQANECLSVNDLMRITKIYGNALYELAK